MNTLLLEYRRDIGRYFRGEAAAYPSIPRGYFDAETEVALAELGREARLFPREELMSEVTALLEKARIDNSWRSTAACVYRNWLNYLSEQKKQRLQASRVAGTSNRSDSSIHTRASASSISPIATLAASGQAPSTTLDCLAQHADHFMDFLFGDDQGRCKQYLIARRRMISLSGRVRVRTPRFFISRSQLRANFSIAGEVLFGSAILHELDSRKKPLTCADVANIGVVAERFGKSGLENVSHSCGVLTEGLPFR